VDFPRHGGMIAASEEKTMTRRPRRNHSPAFKAKVADLRISRRMGADFARSWARVSRHAGQPFHAIVGRLADSFMDSGLSDLVKRFCDGGAFSETFT
jgi:hypothetical protein